MNLSRIRIPQFFITKLISFFFYLFQEMQDNLEKAEARKVTILANMADRILTKFCENFEVWNTAVHCLAYMDFLSSLAEYCAKERGVCIPKFLPPAEPNPYIAAQESSYPCATGDQTYIPNTIVIGRCKEELNKEQDQKKPTVLLLTGPNMGGKSTVMRQIGLTVILAQMVSYYYYYSFF